MLESLQLTFVEVDRVLAKDPSGVRLRKLCAEMKRGEERCRSLLDSGVSPAEAKRLGLLMPAFAAGSELLPILWNIHQRREK